MTARNNTPHVITAWRGLNTFVSRNNIDEQSWIESNNILVNARGEAEALRSPKKFGTALTAGTIFSMEEFRRVAGNVLVIYHGGNTSYIPSTGGAPHLLASGVVNNNFQALSINDTFQQINGLDTFNQWMNDLINEYANGIVPPAIPPVISYQANGSDTTAIASSLVGSYCYMNSTTGHVSQPSPLSNVLGPTIAGFDVRFSFTASMQGGVDKIIFFLSVDGGDIPYNVIDSSGDPISVTNATTTHDINLSTSFYDTLTPEPIYNSIPPLTATWMFGWKDRIFLVVDGGLQYSGYESTYIGNPWESWPVLNQLNIPNREDRVVGGLSTQSGALIFGERDSYLLTGYPSDKVVSPDNIISVTEHIDPLNWSFGITYPPTAVNTPFGAIWVDQTRRIRLWNQQGVPSEIGQPLRTELDAMTGSLKARWFQHGKNGGYYVLTDGTTVLFLMLYLSTTSGNMEFGYGKSTSIAPEAMACVTFSNVQHFYFGKTNQIWEILDPALTGDGWANGTSLFFKIIIGNTGNMNFSSLHSLQLSGDLDDLDLAITHAPMSEDVPVDVEITEVLEDDTGGTFYGMIDSDERRYHILKFTFENDDRTHKSMDSLVINVRNAARLI